jgi:GNAT superfamily N-acetyltransferase
LPRFTDPEPLGPGHVLAGFDCGVGSLNAWLERHARSAVGAGSARTYVVSDNERGRVVGYHALTVASIDHVDATERAAKGMPRHQIPAVLIARLAVDLSVTGRGIGAFLLRDAMVRAVAVSEEAGIRILLVHALDDRARGFYLHFGFEPSPTDSMNLQLLIKDIRASLNAAAAEDGS